MFSYFSQVTATTPSGAIDADALIKEVRSNKHKYLCEQIRSAPDKDTRSKLKAQLPAVTASGTFERRSASALQKHSGLLIADIDRDDNPQIEIPEQSKALRSALANDKHVAFVFESPSGGIKAGVAVKATNKDNHKRAFQAVKEHLADNYGVVIDQSCSDVSRLCFLSYDPKATVKQSEPIDDKQIEPSPAPFWEPTPTVQRSGKSPGDQFDAQCDVAQMLRSKGWTTSNGKHWTRPGKTHGVSGTLGIVGEKKFFCFTPNAPPLEPNKSYSPFALFANYEHGGDFTAAAQALSEQGYGESSLPEVTPQTQSMIAKLVENEVAKQKTEWMPEDVKAEALDNDDPLAAWRAMSCARKDRIAIMEKKMHDAIFVMPDIALVGEFTILNASPNTGKTLLAIWLLCQADPLPGREIYYVNADDGYNGGVEKAKIFEEHGIETLVPDQFDFETKKLIPMLQHAITSGTADKLVVIMDTLKKFVSLMSKEDAREFGMTTRAFTQSGGTLIALAHTNKNKGADGKSVAEGVGDFENDCDCAYTIEVNDVADDSGRRTVTFENRKLRGPVAQKVCYSYDATDRKSWLHRFDSIRKEDNEAAAQLVAKFEMAQLADQHKDVIDFLKREIGSFNGQPATQSALTRNNASEPGSRSDRLMLLEKFDQTNPIDTFQFWASIDLDKRGVGYILNDPTINE